MNDHLITLLLCAVTIWVSNGESDWLDPNDMVNFDHATMTNRRSNSDTQEKEEYESTEKDISNNVEVKKTKDEHESRNINVGFEKEFISIQNDNLDSNSSGNKNNKTQFVQIDTEVLMKSSCTQDFSFYRIYIKKILLLWERKVLQEKPTDFTILARMSNREREILRKYVTKNVGDANEVHDILSKMLVKVTGGYDKSEHYTVNVLMEYSYIAQWGILAITVLAFTLFIMRLNFQVSLIQLICAVLIVSFIVSVPMTWYHMYKQEEAKQVSAGMKKPPPQCTDRELTYWETASEWMKSTFTIRKDPCAEYYEHTLIDPFIKVPPTQALAVTLVKFFITPLGIIGEALGKFLAGTMEPLPPVLWPVPIVLLIIVLFFSFGYGLRIPFLFSLEAPRSQITAPPTQPLENTKKFEELDYKMSSILRLLDNHPGIDSDRCLLSNHGDSIHVKRVSYREQISPDNDRKMETSQTLVDTSEDLSPNDNVETLKSMDCSRCSYTESLSSPPRLNTVK